MGGSIHSNQWVGSHQPVWGRLQPSRCGYEIGGEGIGGELREAAGKLREVVTVLIGQALYTA